MGSSSIVQPNLKTMKFKLEHYDEEIDRAIRFIMEYHAAQGTAEMKAKAPWTDRTGAARNGLFAVTEFSKGHYELIFSHGVHYGIWLEVRFSGRDAIVAPTVISQGRALMSELQRKIR